jgi:phage terminase small subunit
MGLTVKEEKFVQGLFSGLSQRKAYKEAYNTDRMKDETVDSKACILSKTGKVRARLTELQGKVATNNILTEIELQEFWSTTVTSNETEYRDKLKASELLGRNKKMFVDKVEHTIEKMPNIILSK